MRMQELKSNPVGAPCAAPRQRGFTLAEILVTVAVVGVLAGFAIPNLGGFLRNVKMNALSAELVSSLQLGRSEAIKMNRPVLVCRRNTAGDACSVSGTDWDVRGWMVCYSQLSANACDASTAALPNPIRLRPATDTGFANIVGPAAIIRFDPTGSLTAGSTTQTFTITGTWAGATPLTITVSPSGLIKGSRV